MTTPSEQELEILLTNIPKVNAKEVPAAVTALLKAVDSHLGFHASVFRQRARHFGSGTGYCCRSRTSRAMLVERVDAGG